MLWFGVEVSRFFHACFPVRAVFMSSVSSVSCVRYHHAWVLFLIAGLCEALKQSLKEPLKYPQR